MADEVPQQAEQAATAKAMLEATHALLKDRQEEGAMRDEDCALLRQLLKITMQLLVGETNKPPQQ